MNKILYFIKNLDEFTRPSLVIKHIIVTEGVKGIFRGLTPMLWR